LHQDKIHYRDLLPAGQPKLILGGEQRFTWSNYWRLVTALRAERPAIFHSYLNPANFWGRLAALHAGVPVIISSVRARMIEPQYLLAERFLAKRADVVVVNSVGIETELRERAFVPADRIRVVHNFLDLDHFRPPTDAERSAARRQWQLTDSQQVMLMPGRISVQKHQLGLLLALDQLARRSALPEHLVVLFAGRGRGAAYDRLTALLCALPRLRPHVRVLGNQVDVRSLYWAADALCLPSLWEGLPNAALEASACGLPSVLSHAANLDQIVEPDLGAAGCGWEVATGDHRGLAQLLHDEVLKAPRAALRAMGMRGRARVEARFAPERVLAEMLAIYHERLSKTTH
jgi:glycosyltransferase involved in cell wall biosynthesis